VNIGTMCVRVCWTGHVGGLALRGGVEDEMNYRVIDIQLRTLIFLGSQFIARSHPL
jgi:hypothetical protein